MPSSSSSSTSLPNARVSQSRTVERLITGHEVMEGAGVRIRRLLGQAEQRRLDPFLMLDHFCNDNPADYIAGFPDHPHRGFETVTYMLAGRMRHHDSAGHQGLLESGGVQWMSAGRGIIHSEIPEQHDGLMEGFQLWINLPARDKMSAPDYHDLPAAQIPTFVCENGVQLRLIAGSSHGVTGAIQRPVTAPLYLDLHLPAGTHHAQPLPVTHNAFIVVQHGTVQIGGQSIACGPLAILTNHAEADGVILSANEDCRLLLLSAQPLGEPIVQRGPFVMNTEAEIRSTFEDYRTGRFGS
jgi:redox-sensitive bicupin YhaK (pirin superfamily)